MKKAIIKNSYDYQNTANKLLKFGFTTCLITATAATIAVLSKINNNKDTQLENLRQKTGYSTMVNDEIAAVQGKLSQGIITDKEYNAALNKILVSNFEGFLKTSSNKEALTEFNEIQNSSTTSSLMYYLGSSSVILATMTTIGYAYSKLMKKADERKIEEQKLISECESQHSFEYNM